MGTPENPAFTRFGERFQAYPTYEDPARVPKIVVSQTESIIGLMAHGGLSPKFVKDYIVNYTFPYLKTAAQGAGRVFDTTLVIADSQTPEMNEAADFTNIVFGWMHYFATSQYLPNGFARRGMLRAPQDRDEFVRRLREIKFQLNGMASGVISTEMTLDTSVAAFRTYQFLKVGATMPLKFPETEREKAEHARYMMAKMLEGIDTDFFKES